MYGLGILGEKVSAYTTRVVKGHKYLQGRTEPSVLNQFLRSGTSIGANCAEAVGAQSKADFVNKLHIALKEAHETLHWLEVFYDGDYLDEKIYVSMKEDCEEICKLLTTIIVHTKENIENSKKKR